MISNVPNERTQIEILLHETGLEILIANLVHVRNRERTRVWNSKLLTDFGDADIEIISYLLEEDPGLIVEYEEELASLRALSMQENRWKLLPEIVASKRNEKIAIIVTTSVEEINIVQRFLNIATEKNGGRENSDILCSLVYHPQLGRILGGDVSREADGHPIKGIVLSVERAITLANSMNELAKEYLLIYPNRKGNLPIPIALGHIELNAYPVNLGQEIKYLPLSELFQLENLKNAPPEFHRLAILQTLIPSIRTLNTHQQTNRDKLISLAEELFKIIGCGHLHMGIAFSRDAGCCIRPEFITTSGEITDLYFIYNPPKRKVDDKIRQLQYIDLVNALDTLWKVAMSSAISIDQLSVVYQSAIMAYSGESSVPIDINKMIIDVTEVLKNSTFSHTTDRAIMILASSIIAAYQKL